jgi:hypothetical protein
MQRVKHVDDGEGKNAPVRGEGTRGDGGGREEREVESRSHGVVVDIRAMPKVTSSCSTPSSSWFATDF